MKQQFEPNTTLFPVPVVLITCGHDKSTNVFTLNRIASANAEPPMISISVRPQRASHDLITELGEFVVNIPLPDLEIVSDFVGTTTIRETKKWQESGLVRVSAAVVRPPLLADCPVNLECQVRHTLTLPSHSLFVAEVVALHADPAVLNERNEVAFNADLGLVYRSGVVRERPVGKFNPAALLAAVRARRDRRYS